MSCCDKKSCEMMAMSLKEVAKAVGGDLRVSNGTDVNSLVATSACSDSREAHEGSVFVAIAGEHVDGHDYVEKAANLGAVVALVEHKVKLSDGVSIAQIVVDDSVKALGLLAKHNLERRRATDDPFTIVGITGSVGKTTTKDMLHDLLSTVGSTVAPVGSFNNEIGLPLTALHVNSHTRFLVAEMGANHVGEIAGLTRIAPPDIAIVLKVGVAHLGEFGSVDRIAQAKSEIVRGLVPHGIAVLNADDMRVSNMSHLVDDGNVRWFGRELIDTGLLPVPENSYQIFASDITLDDFGLPVCKITVHNESGKTESASLHLALHGEHNIMNALAAANVAYYCGMSLEKIVEVLSKVSHISPHRMQFSKVSANNRSFTLIDDSFNANPDSMKAGIDGLCAFEHSKDSSSSDSNSLFRIAVLGSMLELGGDEYLLHNNIGEYVAQHNVDAVIAVGSTDSNELDCLAECIANGARKAWNNKILTANDAIFFVHSDSQANDIVWDLVDKHPDSVVLLKGSHASGLSALAERWAKLMSC